MLSLHKHAGNGESHCTDSDDSYIKDRLEKLDDKIESIHNKTQGKIIANKRMYHNYITNERG